MDIESQGIRTVNSPRGANNRNRNRPTFTTFTLVLFIFATMLFYLSSLNLKVDTNKISITYFQKKLNVDKKINGSKYILNSTDARTSNDENLESMISYLNVKNSEAKKKIKLLTRKKRENKITIAALTDKIKVLENKAVASQLVDPLPQIVNIPASTKPSEHMKKILQESFARIGCKGQPLSKEMSDYWGGGTNNQMIEKDIVDDMLLYCNLVFHKRYSKRQLDICGHIPKRCTPIADLVREDSVNRKLQPFDMRGKFEAFIDMKLIADMDTAKLIGIKAMPKDIVFRDNPKSSGIQNYFSFLQDNVNKSIVHMYYRCDPEGEIKEDGNDGAYCYGRSEDGGLTFTKPNINKKRNDNLMSLGDGIHAFSAFIDPRPGIPKTERYKGIGVFNERYSKGGWVPFISSDGITYSVVPDKHLFIREKFLNAHGGQKRGKYKYAFDSLNAINYDINLKKFIAIVRVVEDWEHRTFMVQASDDWLIWDDMKWKVAELKPQYQAAEGVYVANAIQCPAKECDHLYVGTATRFNGRILGKGPNGCMKQLKYGLDCEDAGSDAILIFSDMEENKHMPSKWKRASVEPLADFGSINDPFNDKSKNLGHWLPRNTYATRGLIDRPDHNEMWFYMLHDATWPNAHLRRYSIPRFRFGAISCTATANSSPCTVILKTLWVDMDRLDLYINGKAIDIFGYLNVKLQYVGKNNKYMGNPMYSFSNCVTFVGDEIERRIGWGERRWRIRHNQAVMVHTGPRKKMYEGFRTESNLPYAQGRDKGFGLKKFFEYAKMNSNKIVTRVSKETGKKQVAMRMLFEMLKFDIYGFTFK